MQIRGHLHALALALALVATGCSNYSTLIDSRPVYRSVTPAGQLLAQALEGRSKDPLRQLGRYLDAVASAAAVLEKHPGDGAARKDYNFGVSRVFDVIETAGLEPWKAPLQCPGADRVWQLSMKSDRRPERHPANYKLLPADRYQFKGRLVVERHLKEGIGAPLVVVSRESIDATKIDPYAMGKNIYYGMTGLVSIDGSRCVLVFEDPLATETVAFAGHTHQLAADFVAPLALALAELGPRRKELKGMFDPDEFASRTRLARLQPYDPKKIPVLCVHGLGDSQATWAPLIETLRNDPAIRKNYQFWFFSYPTGYPYPLSASVLRRHLDAIKVRYPDHRKLVVLGHSMGGMISRTLITDSGMKLWDVTYDRPPSEMPFSDETRKVMSEALIFRHRPEISRVIFLSASHRGADLATNLLGRIGSKMIGSPGGALSGDTTPLALAKPNSTGEQLRKMPNSIDFLDPENRFVTTLNKIPPVKGIPYHSVIGDRGKGGNRSRVKPVSTDGIVPYWSSHIDGARSELIIPSHHWTNQHPLGIAEVRRILLLHLGRD